jgi:hypothetical protein
MNEMKEKIRTDSRRESCHRKGGRNEFEQSAITPANSGRKDALGSLQHLSVSL